MTLDEALAAVGRCGLGGVEVDAGAPITAAQLRASGLRAVAIDATLLDPAAESWLDALRRTMATACELAAGIVIVWAGDDLGDAVLRLRLYEVHRAAGDLAAQLELTLAFDTLPGLCVDAREMLRTLEELQHPAIQLNFDTGRYLAQNPWSSGEVALQRVFGRLAAVRLTNFTVGVEPAEFPPLGQAGDVDCSRMRQILHGLEFAGPCTIAFQPATPPSPTAEQCQVWLRQSVDHLRGCGWLD